MYNELKCCNCCGTVHVSKLYKDPVGFNEAWCVHCVRNWYAMSAEDFLKNNEIKEDC